MVQVLINMTLVWTLSLLVYELLLRRLTFHRLNRYYLVATLIAGILLPYCHWAELFR